MKDKWSLEGKEIELEFNLRLLGETETNKLQIATLYKKETIETLRKKLIDDLENIREDLFSGRNWKLIMKQKINTRFGVDE